MLLFGAIDFNPLDAPISLWEKIYGYFLEVMAFGSGGY